MLEDEIHNPPETSMDGWMHSTAKLLEVTVTAECNKADIDWYVRKPTDPSPVDPEACKPLGLCGEEDATLVPTFPMKYSQVPLYDGKECMLELE